MSLLRVLQKEPETLTPLRPDIVTVGFPGFMSSRAQMAKYTGPDGVTVLDRTTEEPMFHTKCAVAPRILHNCLPLPEVEELVYDGFSLLPHHWLTMLRTRVVGWIFKLTPLPTSWMHLNKVNLGGRTDQEQCTADIERAVQHIRNEADRKQNEEVITEDGADTADERNAEDKSVQNSRKKLVLFGCSRGATTTLYASLKLPEHLAKHVALVIVEAPFDTMKNVFDGSMWFPRLGMALMKLFGRYEGEAPYAMPDTTHLRCPIAFVTARKDVRVPPALTYRLMEDVRSRFPHIPVHHLELQHSAHATMSVGHPDDQAAYVRFVDDLYDRYVSRAALTEETHEPIGAPVLAMA
jgi:hypothetical protein